MLHKLPHVGRKVTPPQPTFMNNDQKSEYLAGLRNNRPARPAPTGSRPPPFKSRTSVDHHVLLRAESAMSLRGGVEEGHFRLEEPLDIPRSQSSIGHRHQMSSERSVPSLRSTKGRSLVQPPGEGAHPLQGRKVLPTAFKDSTRKSQDGVYRKSGTRWLERQEAHALRRALELMDAKEEEKLHKAAQEEATDLVWQHQHPDQAKLEQAAAHRNPDLSKKFKSHLVRGAHERSQSDGYLSLTRHEPDAEQSHIVSEGSKYAQTASEDAEPMVDKQRSKEKRLSDAMLHLRIASGQAIAAVDAEKLRNFSGGRRRMSGQRKTSNQSTTFPNPEDKIFEEPEETSTRDPEKMAPNEEMKVLKTASRNFVPAGARPPPQKADTMPIMPKARPNPFDRRRKQAEQPKAAAYTSNAVASTPTVLVPEKVPLKDVKEIRSDDIRAATSMKRSDRSTKLPTPVAVNDTAGRPIVSFDPDWEATPDIIHIQEERENPIHSRPTPPVFAVSGPVVPTVSLQDEDEPAVPTINLPDNDDDPYDPPMGLPEVSTPGLPTFSIDGPDEHGDQSAVVALPTVAVPSSSSAAARPLPQHTQSMPVMPAPAKPTARLPWLHRGAPTATCASCTLPISGRIVTASDASQTQKARFHSACFTCAHCSTELESVAFYPEPGDRRLSRLEQDGVESANDPLRFYCHLDFHEFFSPRCRSCKTPIEGEVIVAAGAEYHVGHFFCAGCGDPFESSTPFVEHTGYAYCVSCHRKRTSGRCRGCKAIILDESNIEALGGQWHEACFVCYACQGPFGDEGRFYLREVEVEVTAKERRRGMQKRFEEKPVCQACEAMRLKQ